MKKTFLILLIGIFCFVGSAPVVAMEAMLQQSNPLIGQTAPTFSLPDLKGETNSLDTLRSGQPAILFFWATWCPHCRTQLKEIQSNHGAIIKNGIKMLLIDVGEDKRSVENYLAQNKISLNVLLDARGRLSDKYSILGLPTFVFINQEGVVTAVEHYLPDDYVNYVNGGR